MHGYRFRLQKLMNVKKQLENRKKQQLAAALRVLDREEERLIDIHARGEECRREILERSGQLLDVDRRKLDWEQYRRLMEEVERQTQAVDHSKMNVRRERQELIECKKEHKILENLRKRGLTQYMRELVRREGKEGDEVGRDTCLRKKSTEEA